MDDATPTIYLVDDDADLLTALRRLLQSAGLQVASFGSAQQFLDRHEPEAPGCLVLDLAMPGANGLQLQAELQRRGSRLPIVFLSGHGDIPASVQAMKHGASNFLTKPVDDTELLAAIDEALAAGRLLRRGDAERERSAGRLAALTERERQVMQLVVAGRLNKQIAAALGTSEKTVKFHRGNLMRKLGMRTVADLVRLAEHACLDTTSAEPGPRSS